MARSDSPPRDGEPAELTVAGLLRRAHVLAPVSDTPQLDAQLLLADALQCSRARLLAYPETPVTTDPAGRFLASLQRRQRGEPLAYILGRRAFWDFEVQVDPRVLIPRPETERLVELALDCLADRSTRPLDLLDLGTGSGVIALALARHSSSWQVTASDCSADSLALARDNAQRLGVDNITFVVSDWLAEFSARQFDLIASNPPYVAEGDPHLERDGLPWEPPQALVAGRDGMRCLQTIVDQARHCLRPGAWLIVEHGVHQGRAVNDLMVAAGYVDVRCWQDLGGLDRVTAGRLQRTTGQA